MGLHDVFRTIIKEKQITVRQNGERSLFAESANTLTIIYDPAGSLVIDQDATLSCYSDESGKDTVNLSLPANSLDDYMAKIPGTFEELRLGFVGREVPLQESSESIYVTNRVNVDDFSQVPELVYALFDF